MEETERDTEHEGSENRWSILLICVLSIFMSTLDGSIVNVALPTISDELQVTSAAVAWVVSVYLIAVSATLLLFGRMGDIWSKTRIFQGGLAIFTIGSLLCGVAHTLEILLLARAIQGIGAAGMMANNQGIVTHVFPASERGRALGLCGTAVALGSLVGPALGGVIVNYVSWRYIFWINVPVGIAVFLLGLRLLPQAIAKVREKVDLLGASLIIVTITVFFVVLNELQTVGWTSPIALIGLTVTAVTFLLFIKTERKAQTPLLQLSLFRNQLFSISLICSLISFIALFATNIIIPFYLQDALSFTPGKAGLFMSIFPLVLALVAPVSGYMSDKMGSEILTLLGLLLMSLGLFLLATLTEQSPLIALGIYLAIIGLGSGMFQSPNTSLVMSALPRNKLGIGGSISAFARNLGMLSGVTLATMLLYGSMSSKIGYHVADYIPSRPDVFMFGLRVVFLTVGIICLIGVAITVFRLVAQRKTV